MMVYDEDDYLKLSGIQHFAYCPRQWALIHMENQWFENLFTVDGKIIHENAHDRSFYESRNDKKIVRGMRVVSHELRISGECDIVEFHLDEQGIVIKNSDKRWKIFPVEYKRGGEDKNNAASMQLCAQAMCLEEMFGYSVPFGAIYHRQTHSRQKVEFTESLRQIVKETISEMHKIYASHITPLVGFADQHRCKACSLLNVCVPELFKCDDVDFYINGNMREYN